MARIYPATPTAPVVKANQGVVGTHDDIAAAALVSLGHVQGDAYVPAGLEQVRQYQFIDDGALAGSGSFVLDGVVQAAGTIITVDADQLAQLRFAAGQGAGSDNFRVRAFDGVHWSDWQAGHVATVPVSSSLTAGSERVCNTYTTNAQETPSVAVLSDGGHVVVWRSAEQNSLWAEIYGQRYDATGAPVGGEFRVNAFMNYDQSQPQVIALAGGGFVVAWTSDGEDGSSYGVFGQRYDANGIAQGGEFRINPSTYSTQHQPSLAALADGGFVAVYSSYQTGTDYNIVGMRFDANGQTVGGQFLVNTTIAGNQDLPSVASLADGGFVVAWQTRGGAVSGQRYDEAGLPVGGEFPISSTYGTADVAVCGLTGGGFVATWVLPWDGNSVDVFAQLFDANGGRVGGPFRVNSYANSDQYEPATTALADGGFVISWSSNGQDGSGYGVYAQRYDGAGVAVGGEFRLNQVTGNNQSASAVAARADGGFVAAWQSIGQDGNGAAVVARVYPASPTASGTYQGTQTADTLIGSTGADTLIGGGGADTYLFGRASGADVVDNRGHGADGDIVGFADGIGSNQLWFQHVGNDLKVSIIGESSGALISGWYQDTINRVAEFRLSDGSSLLAGQVENLVSAMAGMTPPALGQQTLTTEQQQLLDPVIAANWHQS